MRGQGLVFSQVSTSSDPSTSRGVKRVWDPSFQKGDKASSGFWLADPVIPLPVVTGCLGWSHSSQAHTQLRPLGSWPCLWLRAGDSDMCAVTGLWNPDRAKAPLPWPSPRGSPVSRQVSQRPASRKPAELQIRNPMPKRVHTPQPWRKLAIPDFQAQLQGRGQREVPK